MKWNSEQKITELYKNYLSQELRSPEVLARKSALLSEFQQSGAPAFHVSFVMPVMALALCAMAVFSQVLAPVLKSAERKPEAVICENPKSAAAPAVSFSTRGPSVKVRKITSHVGPTMVYQKNIGHAPVTIVWVFAGH